MFDPYGLVDFASWLLHWSVFTFFGRMGWVLLPSMWLLQAAAGVDLLEGVGSIVAAGLEGHPLPGLQ